MFYFKADTFKFGTFLITLTDRRTRISYLFSTLCKTYRNPITDRPKIVKYKTTMNNICVISQTHNSL